MALTGRTVEELRTIKARTLDTYGTLDSRCMAAAMMLGAVLDIDLEIYELEHGFSLGMAPDPDLGISAERFADEQSDDERRLQDRDHWS